MVLYCACIYEIEKEEENVILSGQKENAEVYTLATVYPPSKLI